MTAKLPISLIVITLNEERNLKRCLQAADFCAEIIIVDSGSTDGTLRIAELANARIFHRPWSGYGDQKNFGTAQASYEWVLCLDADEVISPELRSAIERRFRTLPAEDAFELNRHSYYGTALINHSGWYPQWRMFLYKKSKARWSGFEPHVVVQFDGRLKTRLAGDLFHYTYSDIRQQLQKNITAAHDAARAMHAKGERARYCDLLCRGPWAFFRAWVLQRGFLDGYYGFVIAVAASYYTFSKYAMLRELQRTAPAIQQPSATR
jgi:glycosyltransferase involved in cell wall biosynthesis